MRGNPQNHLQPSLRRWMLPHLLDLRVVGRFGDFALFDVDHKAVIGTDKPDIEPLFELVPLAADHDPIPIAIRLRTRNDRRDDRFGEPTHSLKKSAELLVFQLELRRVVDMLILASPAVSEISALRHDSMG